MRFPLALSLMAAALCQPAISATPPPVQETLVYVVAIPVPVDQTNAANDANVRAGLANVRAAMPQASIVFVAFDHIASTRADWLAVLDACGDYGFQAIVAFIDQTSGEGYRPTKSGGTWQFYRMRSFVEDAEVIGHPQLYALASLDEPWNPAKTPAFYPTTLLIDMYHSLKALAPAGSNFRVLMNFSRQIWKHGERDDAGDLYYYAPGICDVVLISALEFQRDIYDFATLDANHYESRRIVQRETPTLPLFTTVQVFGSRYGPFQPGGSGGYWFPRERDGYHDLLTMLEDVTRPKYQFEKPLAGIAFQKWDANDTVGRNASFTLGDMTLAGSPPVQVQAANEALAAAQLWITRRDADVDGMVDYWELLNGLNPANASDAALDPDGDGHSNQAEFRGGTNPQLATSALRIDAIWRDAGELRLRFPAAAGKAYTLQYTDRLEDDTWQIMSAIAPVATDRLLEVSAGVPVIDERYYRVGAE